MLFLDGVYVDRPDGSVRFWWVKAPTSDELRQLTHEDRHMTKPKLFGIAASRAFRPVWAIDEVGIDYEHVPTNYMEDSKHPDYLAVNPNGRIPAPQDGETVLSEFMAINLYLAKAYGGDLYPKDPGRTAPFYAFF